MIITDKFKREEIEFCDVEAGVVFKYEDEYYLAIKEITNTDNEIYNCVHLETGECYYFLRTKVKVLDAELIIK